MDARFKKIGKLLSEYGHGNFSGKLALSKNLDEIDAIMSGINMLGEELRAISISRNYFNNIFNSVSDMVLVLNRRGRLVDCNKRTINQLHMSLENLKNKYVDELFPADKRPYFSRIKRLLPKQVQPVISNTYFQPQNGTAFPVQIAASFLINEQEIVEGILLTAKDRTVELRTENLVIRAIVDTQEKERQRLAKDLHDSLGQQLSAVKFYVSATAENAQDTQQKSLLDKSNETLSKIIGDMREICFNLLPKTLEEFGLISAVKELARQPEYNHKIRLTVSQDPDFPRISQELAVDIFRCVQEFIHNAVEHGNAERIQIRFDVNNDQLLVWMKDNGSGFDIPSSRGKGMGLHNMCSRIGSHGGTIDMQSSPGKGVRFLIRVTDE